MLKNVLQKYTVNCKAHKMYCRIYYTDKFYFFVNKIFREFSTFSFVTGTLPTILPSRKLGFRSWFTKFLLIFRITSALWFSNDLKKKSCSLAVFSVIFQKLPFVNGISLKFVITSFFNGSFTLKFKSFRSLTEFSANFQNLSFLLECSVNFHKLPFLNKTFR